MTDRGSKGRTTSIAIAALALGAAFGPGLATGAIEKVQDVVVKNTTASPVPTRDVGTPVTGSVILNFTSDDFFKCGDGDTIPAGKRLTIDFVAFSSTTDVITASIEGSSTRVSGTGGASVIHRLALIEQKSLPGAQNRQAFSGPVKIFKEFGLPHFCVNLLTEGNSGQAVFTFSGTLTDL